MDGQFGKAGFSEALIEECHGSIHYLQCLYDCTSDIWPATDFEPVVDTDTCQLVNDLPKCLHCGSVARPNILMFEDGTWNNQRQSLQSQRMREFLSNAERPVVIEVGAGTAISTVRHFSQWTVKGSARLIRINPESCDVGDIRDIGLPMNALEALRAINGLIHPI